MIIDLHTLNFYSYILIMILPVLVGIILRDVMVFLFIFEMYVLVGYFLKFYPIWIPLFFAVILIGYFVINNRIRLRL